MTENISRNLIDSRNFNGTLLEVNTEILEYGWSVKIPLIAIGVVLFVWDILALATINFAKRTPQLVRFFSTALISFEIVTLIAFTIRKLIFDISRNTFVYAIGAHFVLLSFVTVCLMSAERLVLFTKKGIYLQHVHVQTFRRIAISLWIMITLSYYGSVCLICPILRSKICETVISLSFGVFLFAAVAISIACYIRIYFVLSTTTDGEQMQKRTILKLRATGLGFMYLLVTICGLMSFMLNLIFKTDLPNKTLQMDIYSLVNCALDPFLHVWWFKECQIQFLSIFSKCFPSLTGSVERMKISLFDIVTYSSSHAQNKQC